MQAEIAGFRERVYWLVEYPHLRTTFPNIKDDDLAEIVAEDKRRKHNEKELKAALEALEHADAGSMKAAVERVQKLQLALERKPHRDKKQRLRDAAFNVMNNRLLRAWAPHLIGDHAPKEEGIPGLEPSVARGIVKAVRSGMVRNNLHWVQVVPWFDKIRAMAGDIERG